MTKWTVETLLELMDERDRRYTVERDCAKEAVLLAKQVADKAKATVNIVTLVSVISLIIGVLSYLKK